MASISFANRCAAHFDRLEKNVSSRITPKKLAIAAIITGLAIAIFSNFYFGVLSAALLSLSGSFYLRRKVQRAQEAPSNAAAAPQGLGPINQLATEVLGIIPSFLEWKEMKEFFQASQCMKASKWKMAVADLSKRESPALKSFDSLISFLKNRSVHPETKRRLNLSLLEYLSVEQMEQITQLVPDFNFVRLPYSGWGIDESFHVLTRNGSNLRHLIFSPFRFSFGDLRSLLLCQKLSILEIRGSLTLEQLKTIGQNCPIETLILERVALSWNGPGDQVLLGLPEFKKLRFLTIDELWLGDDLPRVAEACTKLEKITLNQCQIKGSGIPSVEQRVLQQIIDRHPTLQHIEWKHPKADRFITISRTPPPAPLSQPHSLLD